MKATARHGNHAKQSTHIILSRKLSETQMKFSVTKFELLSIVKCLKQFKGMLWGQQIKVYTDHKNHVKDALGLLSDRSYCS